jgi:putative transposase
MWCAYKYRLRPTARQHVGAGTVEQPGTDVAAKRGLNRSILDAGWATFASILAGKAEEAGRTLVRVNPRHTSQLHWRCGRRGDRAGVEF